MPGLGLNKLQALLFRPKKSRENVNVVLSYFYFYFYSCFSHLDEAVVGKEIR